MSDGCDKERRAKQCRRLEGDAHQKEGDHTPWAQTHKRNSNAEGRRRRKDEVRDNNDQRQVGDGNVQKQERSEE